MEARVFKAMLHYIYSDTTVASIHKGDALWSLWLLVATNKEMI